MSHHLYSCTGCGRSDFDDDNELMIHEQTCEYIDTGDTGERRRATDRVSYDRAVELVASLAMEKALERGDTEVLSEVEAAILKLRERGMSATGEYKTLPSLLRRQAE